VFFLELFGCCLVDNTSANDCSERLVSEMIYYVLSCMLNSAHSLTHSVHKTTIVSSVIVATNEVKVTFFSCMRYIGHVTLRIC